LRNAILKSLTDPRQRDHGFGLKRDILRHARLVLQLHFLPSFIVGGSGVELMRSAPERPGDDKGLA
jgi:hypothetical protein